MIARTVFFLTKNFPPVICGVGDYTYELYKRLEAVGYRVKVITEENEEVKEFINENKMAGDVYPIIKDWNLVSVKRVVTLIKKENADWFCIQYVPYSYSRLGFPFFLVLLQLLVRLNGIKTGIFFHEVAVRPFFNGFKAFVTGTAQRFIGYGLYTFSSFALTNNLFYKPYFKPFPISVIPVPANLYGEKEMMNQEKQNTHSKIKLTAFMNRCNKQVIEAVAECIGIDKLNIDLTIIGVGTRKRREQVDEYISLNNLSDGVFFYDKIGKSDIARALYASDIFLQMEYVSERGEGGISSKSGTTAAAMAAGLAIIGPCGDMTDPALYKNGENILLTESDSSESIRKCIRQLYSDSSLRLHLSKNARKTYGSYFSWERTVKAYISEFEKKVV